MIQYLKHLRLTIRRIVATLITSASLISLVLNNNIRSGLKHFWMVGWSIALIALIFAMFLFPYFAKALKSRNVPTKDIEILETRLKDFGPTSQNLLYLTHSVSFAAFPTSLLDEVERLVLEWTADTRILENDELRKSFNDLTENMFEFYVTCNMEMFPLELRKTNAKEIDYERMQIPPEWKHEQPERYNETMEILNEKLLKLIRSIQKMNQLIHKYK